MIIICLLLSDKQEVGRPHKSLNTYMKLDFIKEEELDAPSPEEWQL
jgi:hypothetical protein